MLLIGPLHHSKKDQTAELSKTDLRYLDYMKMERHKGKYLENFALWYGNQTVEEFRRIIRSGEQIIRACYAESTEWIESQDFVEMMLHDSVFILVFFMQLGPRYMDKTGDFLFDEPCYQNTIFEDLILLENHLPCLRNIMALEQSHYSYTAFVCNYITFFDFLIDTEQDVDFLVKKGVLHRFLKVSPTSYLANSVLYILEMTL